MKNLIHSLYLLALLTFLTACSSSGGGTPADTIDTSPATITSANSQDLSIAATESAKQAVTADSASLFKTSNSSNSIDFLLEKIRTSVSRAQSLGPLCSGGGSYSDNISSNSTSATITFSNCNMGSGLVINGGISVSSNGTSSSYTYNNFTVTINGLVENFDGTVTCDFSGSTTSCTSSSSIRGIDGRTYAVNNATVTGNSFSGYNVSASVVDPTHGTISIDAQNVKFDCTAPNEGRPSTGTISITSNSLSASVTFDSCSSYTVTFNGVANLYTW